MHLPADFLELALRSRHAQMARISRILHDDFSQALSAAGLELDLLQLDFPGLPADLTHRLENLRHGLERTFDAARGLMNQLRPDLAAKAGFLQAMRTLAQAAALGTPALVEYRQGCERTPAPAAAEAAHEIAAHALDNALRHSGASRIVVEYGEVDGALEVGVRDDGRGFDPAAVASAPPGLGIPWMRLLAQRAGLGFSLESRCEGGTIMRLRLS